MSVVIKLFWKKDVKVWIGFVWLGSVQWLTTLRNRLWSPPKSPTYWVLVAVYQGDKAVGASILTTHLHLMHRLRMHGFIPPLSSVFIA
jgi:hypothetical protein